MKVKLTDGKAIELNFWSFFWWAVLANLIMWIGIYVIAFIFGFTLGVLG